MTEKKPKYVSPSKAAEQLGLCAETIRKALREGRVPGAVRSPGGHWRVPLKYVESQVAEAP